jgi:pimeloyl-ACP methyl ester carboxylesterase
LRERVFSKPTTVIAGALSDYIPGGDASAFAPMFPKLTVEVVAGAGHWVHADKPTEFIAAMRRALAR